MHPLIQATMQNAPGISYTLHSIYPGTLRESIFQKDVDLGVFVTPINDDHIRSSHLVSTVTAVITRADHPVYGCKENLSEDDFFNADGVLINSELRRASNFHREVKANQGSAGILVHDLAQGFHRRSGPSLAASADGTGGRGHVEPPTQTAVIDACTKCGKRRNTAARGRAGAKAQAVSNEVPVSSAIIV